MHGKQFDALVIGSGAAGSFAAKELTQRGLDVLLLEAGPNITEDDFKVPAHPRQKGINLKARAIAVLRGQYIQARIGFFGEQFKHLFVNDWKNPYTTPPEDFYLWIRGRQLGGRLHLYGRVLLRMTDYDFKAASRDGFGEDWPISYADIAPYYDQVEEFLGLYGTEDKVRNLPDGKYLYPPKLTALEQAFKAKVEANWPDRSVISWRYAAPNLKRVPLPILAAKETGRLTIRTDAIVKRITVDAVSGKATGAEFIDRLTKKTETVSANVVVLCASTIESVRLLLNSASPRHPNGLANSSGLLGRYFMDQCPSQVYGTVPGTRGWELDDSAPPDPFYAPSGGVYIPRFQNLDNATHPKFARGFAFQGAIGRGFVPEDSPAIFGIMGFGETLPYFDNCITLNPRRKDAWGIPVPHIKCSFSQNERLLLREQVRAIQEMVDYCGYKVIFSGSTFGLENEKNAFPDADWLSRFMFRKSFKKSLAVGAAIHECSGARMGNDPAKSVLNSYNQSWDVKNLFVTDGSCFVSSGTVGPALTIMALTVRACEYIANEYKTNGL
ncbi:MAG: GMC family oxidoreductase [Acidobacteriaceae bacterium]|jgi:choline dehydrogenase-like flavoprotein